MNVAVFRFGWSPRADWLGLVLPMLQVPIIENNPTSQRDIDAKLRWNLYHVVTVLQNIGRQRAFLWSHDVVVTRLSTTLSDSDSPRPRTPMLTLLSGRKT